MLILFWLAWYVTGPVCEWFDFWDPPRQEEHDVVFYAGGGITLFAAGVGVALALAQKCLKECRNAARPNRDSAFLALTGSLIVGFIHPVFAASDHSPPMPLRI